MIEDNEHLDRRGGTLVNILSFSALFMVLCGLLYPVGVGLAAGTVFKEKALGSLIEVNGEPMGSSLVGQPFLSDEYFYGRPSAADYDPTGVSGSNLAPSNPELRAQARATSEQIQAREKVTADEIPVDLIAASGSGIDPHISPAGARIQVERVARARGLQPDQIMAVVEDHTEGPVAGILGATRVNVLELNIDLDAKWPNTRPATD